MDPPALHELRTPLIAFTVTLCMRALFSFLETSITALRLFKLKELADSVKGYEGFFTTLEKNPQRILITILIANNLADVTSAALATHIMEVIFAHLNLSGGLGFSAGIAFATLSLLIFGEVIPKNIAKTRGESLFKSTLWIANALYYILYPFVTILMRFSEFFVHRIESPGTEHKSEWVASEKEIQFLINHITEKGLIESEKTEMLQNIFDLGRTPVKEVLLPATDIISVNIDTSIQDALKTFLRYRFSRLPVYQGSTDNILGMIYFKDLIPLALTKSEKTLRDIMRPILLVPETLKVNQLLREFRQQHMHIAIVLNEYGSVTGLITLEDVLEEIVGEISDEHELASEDVVQLRQGGWLAKGHTSLGELGSHLGITFEAENSLTLGGFLTEQLQHLPQKGERVLYKNLYFQVQKATPKRVLQVLIFHAKDENAADLEDN